MLGPVGLCGGLSPPGSPPVKLEHGTLDTAGPYHAVGGMVEGAHNRRGRPRAMNPFAEPVSNDERYAAQLSLVIDPLNSGIAGLSRVVDTILESSKLHRGVAAALLQHINANDELPLLRTTLARHKDHLLALITGLAQEIVTAIKAAGGRRSSAGRRACATTLAQAGDIFYDMEANAADHPAVKVPAFLRSEIFDRSTGRHQWIVLTVTRFVHSVAETIPGPADPADIEARMNRIGRWIGRALQDLTKFVMRSQARLERRRRRRCETGVKQIESDDGDESGSSPLRAL